MLYKISFKHGPITTAFFIRYKKMVGVLSLIFIEMVWAVIAAHQDNVLLGQRIMNAFFQMYFRVDHQSHIYTSTD
ncbi:hypothetical protein D3C74_287730 [compost metagenome]